VALPTVSSRPHSRRLTVTLLRLPTSARWTLPRRVIVSPLALIEEEASDWGSFSCTERVVPARACRRALVNWRLVGPFTRAWNDPSAFAVTVASFRVFPP
jgi:hypothetical protein